MAKIKNIACALLITLSSFCAFSQSDLRTDIANTALSQLGTYELTGHNDGVQVELYLRSVNLGKGNPWCAAFISWCYQMNCIKVPKSGYCPVWFPKYAVVYQRGSSNNQTPLKGDVMGIYFAEKKRIAHVGIILEWKEKEVITIEGNTNDAGSREGDGVYKKRRLKRQVYAVSRWV